MNLIVNILKLVILLVTSIMGVSYYKKIGKELKREDDRIDEAIKSKSEDEDPRDREDVRSTIKRLDNLKSLIDEDPRFEEDDFTDENMDYIGSIKLVERQVFIEIPTYSDKINNDLNCLNLYLDLVKSECDDLSLFVKTYVYNKNNEEINLKQGEYKSLSDLPKEFRKVIVIKVNKGCDDSIVELLYHLTHGYELDGLDGDGTYNINGRNQYVQLQAFSPLEFSI